MRYPSFSCLFGVWAVLPGFSIYNMDFYLRLNHRLLRELQDCSFELDEPLAVRMFLSHPLVNFAATVEPHKKPWPDFVGGPHWPRDTATIGAS